MKFVINPVHVPLGNNLSIQVVAEADERITTLRIECDDRELSDDALNPPQVFYQRDFSAVTGFTPGTRHKVRVFVKDQEEHELVASREWVD